MNCKIISTDQSQEFQELTSVILPEVHGEMEILPGHAESFEILQEGVIILKNNSEKEFPISGGVCYIKDDLILITL